MVERLQTWAREHGHRNPYDNSGLIASYRQRLQAPLPDSQRMQVEFDLANELLNAGQPEACLTVLSNVTRMMWSPNSGMGPKTRTLVQYLEAVAWLRLGEIENCVHHHNPDSCLLPIQADGQHMMRRGSEGARDVLLKLTRRPSDLGARWLLNIAAMTLGEYPDQVPANLRVPPDIFRSEHPLPRFPDRAHQVGLTMNKIAGGSVTEDFDGDGWTDVFLTSWHIGDAFRLFKNMGNGRFEDRTREAGLDQLTGGLNAIQADYNNDGHVDLYVVRGAWLGELGTLPDSLLRNNGDGTFTDVTEEAGLLALHPALSATWLDANNDGWIDLFVGNETYQPNHPHPCALYLNTSDGRFRECGQAAGVNLTAFVRGVTAGDFDNDGWPDLYVSVLGGRNRLLRNHGAMGAEGDPGVRFTDVTTPTGVAEPELSFPTWFWDYDNDGWLDLFACGYGADLDAFSPGTGGHATLLQIVADKLGLPSTAATPRLYHNQGGKRFSDVTRAARLHHAYLAMGANFGDLDNDGWLDCYLGTGAPYFGTLLPNEMLRNHDGREFQNVTSAGGFGHVQKGHGISFADLNNDGQQDVVVNVGGAYPGDNYFDALFANPGNAHHWITLKLEGRRSNRGALGARIKVVVREDGKDRELHRVVGSGGSFGASPLRQEIGLGDAAEIRRVEIWWPSSGGTNLLEHLAPDRHYRVVEGDDRAEAIMAPPFAWPAN